MSIFGPVRLVAASMLLGGSAVLVAPACAPTDPGPSAAALDESASPSGTDADGNGVRDDIDQAIDQAPVNGQMKAYLIESAKVEGRIMALDVEGDPGAADTAYEIASDANRLVSCVPAGLDPVDALGWAENLRLLIANTDEREAQLAAFSRLIDGRAFPAPDCGEGV
jgi:hypothetical protein